MTDQHPSGPSQPDQSQPDHQQPEQSQPEQPPREIPATRQGFGRILIVVYAVFALAATARSVVQITTKYSEAPLAYSLSAFAAVVYIVATVALVRGDRTSRRVATVAITVELVGVLVVGAASLLFKDHFPRATVWSVFGEGYGFVPLLLPFVGLWWLRRTAPA